MEGRAYLAVQVSFGGGIIDDPGPVQPVDFTIGRFNGGTKVDLAVHYHWPGHTDVYEVLLGHGDGTFELSGGLTDYSPSEGKLATGDWNGDGKLDLFASRGNLNSFQYPHSDNSGQTVLIGWRGDGTGKIYDSARTQFVPGGGDDDRTVLFRATRSIRNYTTADMTDDGKTDLITVGTEGLAVWRSIAEPGRFGTFAGAIIDTSATFLTVNALDANGDGLRDVITTALDASGYKIAVKLKNADGSYSGLLSSPLSATPTKLRMADFNGDRRLDAAVLETSSAGSRVDIAFGNGDGTFKAPTNYKLNAAANDFTVGDFDFDGRPDVAFTLPTVPGLGLSRSFGILRNRGDGTMERADSPRPDQGTDMIDSADFNGDGKADLIVRYAESKSLAVLLNTAGKRSVIRGTAFNDLNQDQVHQATEPLLNNWRIYNDANDNGTFEPGEDSATTLADGTWEMRVPNGLYRIRQELPPRWTQTAPYGFAAKTEARLVSIAGLVTSSRNDFGAYDRGNISGIVYNDSNANKTFDPFEGGRRGVTVYLDTNGNKSFDPGEPNSLTDANGRYKFDVGIGTYVVRAVVQAPAGWQATGAASYTAKITSPTSVSAGLDFGQTQPATISGHVYYDYAANGRRDTDDVGVGGLRVFLDTNKNGRPDAGEPATTTSTSANAALKGGYSFTGQYPGTYHVGLVKPTGYQQVTPAGGDFVTFAYGSADTTYTDFGIIRPINVSGRAYGDSNANGAIDTGESGAPDVPVFIDYNANGIADLDEPQKRTDAAGNYTLSSTREGTFNVRALRRSGFSATAPSSSLYAVKFTYGAAATTGRDFGLIVGAFTTAPYQAPVNINTGSNPTALAAGDFNGDKKPDFIVASNGGTSRVFLGQGNGLFTAGQQFSTGDSTRYLIAVDVSGDGKADLVAANEALDFGAAVFIGNGDGTFKAARQYAVTTNTFGVAAADFNGDGKLDLAYVGTTDGRVAILINKGDGTFNNAKFVTNTFGGKSIVAGDVNGDKKADLVVANPSANALSVLLGAGNGTFSRIAADVTSGISQPNFVRLADVNNDRKLDLVAINEFSDEVRVKLGNGNGTFAAGRAFSTASTPTQVAVLDIDRDGKLDLIVSCRSDGTSDVSGGVSVLRGRGDGTFADQQIRTAHTSPTAVAVADYNRDGKLDIVAANFFSDDVSALFNGTAAAAGSIKGIVWNDFDSDGVRDTAEPALAGQTVYTDVNKNGAYDAGERMTQTAADGSYALLDLPAGSYEVRAVVPAALAQTSPANRGAQLVTLAAGQAVTGKNIGETPITLFGTHVFDDLGAALKGAWTRGSATGQYGSGFLSAGNSAQGIKTARFDLKVSAAGYFQVAARWVAGGDRASNARVDIQTATNRRTVTVNQRKNGATWFDLGVYYFDTGGGSVAFRTSGANGLVIADAVRLVPVPAPPTVVKDNTDAAGINVTGTWTAATTPTGFIGGNFLDDGNPATKGGRSVGFRPSLASGGVYEVFARWTAGRDRASNARYDIATASGTSTVSANQRAQGGVWVSLGFFDLNPATARVTVRNDGANGRVIADAVRFARVG